MTYGAGHNCVVIRGATAADLVLLIRNFLASEVSRQEAHGYARVER